MEDSARYVGRAAYLELDSGLHAKLQFVTQGIADRYGCLLYTSDYYSNITFGRGGHERLRDTLLSVQGKFLLSYNDHPLVWEMYDRPGIYIERVTRLNNMKQRYDGGAQFPELFVSNYDQSERIRVLPEQLSFAS